MMVDALSGFTKGIDLFSISKNSSGIFFMNSTIFPFPSNRSFMNKPSPITSTLKPHTSKRSLSSSAVCQWVASPCLISIVSFSRSFIFFSHSGPQYGGNFSFRTFFLTTCFLSFHPQSSKPVTSFPFRIFFEH